MTYDPAAREAEKMHTLDRVIVLKPKEGEKVLSAQGSFDTRLFTGENKLHAIYRIETGLWFMKYDNGVLPQALQCQFQTLDELMDFVRGYYQKRNVEIQEVVG